MNRATSRSALLQAGVNGAERQLFDPFLTLTIEVGFRPSRRSHHGTEAVLICTRRTQSCLKTARE